MDIVIEKQILAEIYPLDHRPHTAYGCRRSGFPVQSGLPERTFVGVVGCV